MFPMGIDLEQPSAESHKEDSTPNVNANMVVSSDKGHDRERVVANLSHISRFNKENAGVHVSGGQKTFIVDGINLNSVKELEPREDMEFESKEEAFSFYVEYAKSVGFAAVTKASRRSRISGKFIDAKFACSRYGTKREHSSVDTPESVSNQDLAANALAKKRNRISLSLSKTDCKASMHVKRRRDGRWIIQSFIKEHNHEIYPDEAYHFRGRRSLNQGSKNADAMHSIHSRTKKTYVSMSRQSAGCNKLDNRKGSVTNQLDALQHLDLEERDAQAMLDHFIYMQDENPNFFYVVDLNGQQCLRNVFWVDAKGRLDYGCFNDVVLLDTTYIKNEYKLPLAFLSGVNHHFQFLLLGCALVADETRSTYIWLLRAWLRAMGGRAPRVILTDQDETLKEAIAEVFPNSRHCFCLWHVLRKMPEKLDYVIRQHDNFLNKFDKCIFKSHTDELFDKRWHKIVDKFNLINDGWFRGLYEDRERWVPTYMRGIFLAGMSTAQRSNSINSVLDKYIHRKTTLSEFFDQYRTILQEKSEEEAKAEFETWHKQPALKSPSLFGKQMANLYTHAIFKKFQVEVLGVVACHPKKEHEDGVDRTFRVQDFEQNQDFLVVWNETSSDISCLCHVFEFHGFLCRHIMIVLQMYGVQSIPPQYVLKRWTKDAKSRQTTGEKSGIIDSRVQRYNDLCQRAFRLGDEASLCQESYTIAVNALEEALRKCESINNSIPTMDEQTSPKVVRSLRFEGQRQDGNTFRANKEDNTTQKKQVHTEPEVMSFGLHSSWQQMEQLCSRPPAVDGYFGSQQLVQETIHGPNPQPSCTPEGQNNSSSSMHDACYMSQQRMRGTGQLQFMPQTFPSYGIQDGLQDMDQTGIGGS